VRRRRWFDWHSWVGVNLSLLMTFVLLTGTLACVSRELDWLFIPEMRAKSSAPVSGLPWDAMLASFQGRYPNAEPHYFHAPVASWFAPELIAATTDGKRFRVYFDAASGEVQGTSAWFNWQRFLRQAHRHLMLPLNLGLSIVGLLSLPLLVSFWTSLHIYKRWWTGFLRFPAAKRVADPASPAGIKTKRRFWGDLHRLAGVWSLWFVLLMAVTGAWYLAEQWGLAATYPAPPLSSETGADANAIPSLDEMVKQTRDVYPALAVSSILIDAKRSRVLLQGQADAWLVRERANHVAYGLDTGRQIEIRRGEELNWHIRIAEAADPLHFGTLGGNVTRFVWAGFGALLTGLAASGVYLYGIRLLAGRQPARHAQSPLGVAFKQLPMVWSLPSLALVLICLVLGIGFWIGLLP